MFEDCGDADLLEAMGTAQRAERVACARQLLAAGTFALRRMKRVCTDRELWCVDDWEAIAAEVGAELGISRARASSQMSYGQALIERFPTLGRVFLAGQVDFRVIAAAIYRTDLIQSPHVLAAIDARLATAAPAWNKLSRDKITELVDWMVIELDPDAIRIATQRDLDRHIEVRPGPHGTAEIWGEVRGPAAAAFDAKLNDLAASVCPNDPRTPTQRRADALDPLAAGAATMPCTCGAPDCPATTDKPATPLVINVIAEAATIEASSDKPGYLPGYGAVPADTLRRLAAHAALRPVPNAKDLGGEPRYRPSAALRRFIQCRDLTCQFPGCDQPAVGCDIDHTVPWPYGPTHPSNTTLNCRTHHLLKTFHTGWSVRQHPDGTLVWTTPSGRTHTTTPTGAWFFPQLALPTHTLRLPQPPPPSPNRTLAMPLRKRTRAQDRAYRIQHERALNRARYEANPPPF